MICSNAKNKIKSISILAQVASILEVSSKKPGNITPEHDFSDTTYEDFLAGSLAIGEGIEEAVSKGILTREGKISVSEIKIGELIKKCILDVRKSHSGGNTHLGMVMLMIPIAAASGISISQGSLSKNKLKKNIKRIIGNSTPEDSLNFYDAIRIFKVGGLRGKLIQPEIPFHELMKISSRKDRIAQELRNGLKITFWVSEILSESFRKIKDIRKAILQSYLETLAKFPDMLIAKKVSLEKAKEISKKAKKVLELGGVETEKGRKEIEKFDKELRDRENKLNPGTTADLIAAGLFLYLLK